VTFLRQVKPFTLDQMTEIRQERYINPYTDFGFKKLIGKEQDHERIYNS